MKNTIKSTMDYDKFKLLSGNRKLNKAHINKLKSAFSQNTEAIKYSPILVNEDWEIVDGQHRFEATRSLGLPVFYNQQAGLTLSDTQAMNSMMKNWGPRDYADSYAAVGNRNYIEFVQLMDKYSLPFNVIMKYAAGYGRYPSTQMFRSGTFVVGDLNQAREHLDYLVGCGDYYAGYRRKGFGEAVLVALNNPKFDRKRFISALTSNYAKKRLRPLDSMPEYLRVITEIYNHHLPEEKRVMFFDAAI